MAADTYDRKVAESLRETFVTCFKGQDAEGISKLYYPDAREDGRDDFESFFTAGYSLVSAKIAPYKEPNWPTLQDKTQEFWPPPTCSLLVKMKNKYGDREEFLALAPVSDGDAYCVCHFRDRGGQFPLPAKLNLDEFRTQVRDAARKSFESMRLAHPHEEFYAFALYSDDDGITLSPAANTLSGLARKAKSYGFTTEEKIAEIRWAPAEWEVEEVESRDFSILSRQLYAAYFGKIPVKGGRFRFARRVFEAAIAGLEELEKEGFFGRGEPREKVTVFFTIMDSDLAPKIERESVRRLNPASVYKRFLGR